MDNKRQLILETALKLFVNQGFHATPTSLIASEAGVANGTLFHYFKTKEELINILYLETKDEYFNIIVKDFDYSKDIKERMHSIWINTINWALQNPNDFRFIQQFSNSPFISQLTHEQISRHYKFFEEQFEVGVRNNIIKDLPVSLLLQISLFQIYGFISYLFDNQEKFSDQTIMETTYKSYWDSIKL